MALPFILTYAFNQLDQRGIILIYNNTKRAIHSGGSFVSPPLHPTPYTLHSTPYTLHLTPHRLIATTSIAHSLLPIARLQITILCTTDKTSAHIAQVAVVPPLSSLAHPLRYRVPLVSAIYLATPSESDKPCPLAAARLQTRCRANKWYQPLRSSG